VIAPLAARGFEVHGSARTVAAGEADFVAHPADLLAPGAAAALLARVQPSHLLHLAWIATPGRYRMAPENEAWVAATVALYRAFADAGGARAVFAGSCAEYDWSHATLHETDTPSQLIEAAAGPACVSTAWARIFFLYGPHEPRGRLVSDVINALLEGRVAETSRGTQERDFMHVADVAEALAALVDGEVTGTVNIASGHCVPVRRIAETLGRLAGRPDLLAIGALPSSADEPARLAADVSRMTRELAFVPRYGLEDGLAATLDWWRSR
jgi:nucleoside-diphosphate-sugar epimerase